MRLGYNPQQSARRPISRRSVKRRDSLAPYRGGRSSTDRHFQPALNLAGVYAYGISIPSVFRRFLTARLGPVRDF